MDNTKKPQAESSEKVTKKLTLDRTVVQSGLTVKTSVRAGRPGGGGHPIVPGEWDAAN